MLITFGLLWGLDRTLDFLLDLASSKWSWLLIGISTRQLSRKYLVDLRPNSSWIPSTVTQTLKFLTYNFFDWWRFSFYQFSFFKWSQSCFFPWLFCFCCCYCCCCCWYFCCCLCCCSYCCCYCCCFTQELGRMFASTRSWERRRKSRELLRVGVGESSVSATDTNNTSFATWSTTKRTIEEIWGSKATSKKTRKSMSYRTTSGKNPSKFAIFST